jgi:hypothetical protein
MPPRIGTSCCANSTGANTAAAIAATAVIILNMLYSPLKAI